MGTRSRIGLVMKTGAIISIYCHWDGSLGGVGRKLFDHYTDPKKIRALIALGDISSLRAELAPPPGTEHPGEAPSSNVTTAYGRDRGEKGCKAVKSNDVEAFLAINSGQEYSYLYDGEWNVWDHDDNPPTGPTPLIITLVTERLTS